MDVPISREWLLGLLKVMRRPRLVCSCKVPVYAENLFDIGEYRFRCSTCRGYVDLLWIYEGYFPEPPKNYVDPNKE